MIQLKIVTVGTLKEDYLKEALSEYKKRLSQYAKIEEISIKEELIKNEDDRSEISRALECEGDKILASLPKDAYKIALCVEGKQCTSVDFAHKIEKIMQSDSKIKFVIGGSDGLSE